jgi:hypothetical protein
MTISGLIFLKGGKNNLILQIQRIIAVFKVFGLSDSQNLYDIFTKPPRFQAAYPL